MATQQILKSAYAAVSRIAYSNIPVADLARLDALGQQVDAAALSLTAARVEVGKMVFATTSVANLSYAFFTGATPLARGLDYLISPTGPNPTNLNSAYYAAFSAENRYINFAVNLASQPRFTTSYGQLDLSAAATKAYTEIFGFAPEAGKIDALLNAQVSNGLGGTFTRAEYFAAYGRDGLTGPGTKAATIGWLLSEAAKANLGVYAKANDALLADLTVDGQASFNTDLLGSYGAQPVFGSGATIAITETQSVSPAASTPSLQSTTSNDTATGVDSNASQTISTSDGHDTITLSGTVGGFIDGGAGNDTITLGVLNAAVEVLGGAPNGTVNAGAGNDLITIGRVVDGAIIDGGTGDDTAIIGISSASVFTKTKITGIEHLVISDFAPTGGSGLSILNALGYTGLRDLTTRASQAVVFREIAEDVAVKMEGSGGLAAHYKTQLVFSGTSSRQVGVSSVDAYLSGVTSGANLTVAANEGALKLHVQSDSVMGAITSQSPYAIASPIIVSGTGRLTAGFVSHVVGAQTATQNLDASASAGIDVTEIGSDAKDGRSTTVVLSSANDSVAANLRGQSTALYTLGAGADVFKLYRDGLAAPHFSNLAVENGKVTTMATITDFAKGIDTVKLGTVIPLVTTGLSAGSATTTEQALINVSGQLAANGTTVFEYGGDTYIYHQDATVGVNSGDGLIRLIGVTGLSVGTGISSADIHYG